MKTPKKIAIGSKMGNIIRVGDVYGMFMPSTRPKYRRAPDVTNAEIVELLEKAGVHDSVSIDQFVDVPTPTVKSESNKSLLLKVYIGKPEPRKIEIHQAAYWPINTTDYIAIEFHRAEQHDFSGFESALNDLDMIDFGDLPTHVHLLVEQIFNREPVGYALTSHVLQDIEDRAYQMTV